MLLESFLQDVRIGCRVLLREKSFCALAVFVLALGICGVTTQFSLVNAIALRGFNFPHADRLMGAGFIDPTQPANGGGVFLPFEADYADVAAAQQSFEQTAAYISGATVNVTVDGAAQRYTGGYVTEDFFRVIGVEPMLGRNFTAADNQPGAERVVLISHEIWQRDFGADPKAVGLNLRVNGQPATVIGVMPPGFKFPTTEQLWVPVYNQFPLRRRDDPQQIGVGYLGRLKPGVTIDQASAELTMLAKRLAAANPKTNQRFTAAVVQPLAANIIGANTRQAAFAMLGAVAIVLLIACVNVMNMQFARATLRAKELAVRGALGATRWRLVRQMLTESLLLATLGSVLGVVLATWGIELLTRATAGLSFPLPSWVTFDLDRTVVAFTVGATLLAAVFSGLVPALLTSRANAADVMKESGRGNTSKLVNRLTAGLVVAQIALTAALLVASTLQVRSIVNRASVDYGYDDRAVFSARMGLFQADYPTLASRVQFYDRALRQLRAAPEVAAAALTSRFQMTFDNTAVIYEVEGESYPRDSDRPKGNSESVSDDYFAALGLKVLEGRAFLPDDTDAKQPVALVNASFAHKHFPRGDALGHRVRPYNAAQPAPWRTIVGIVPDTRMEGPFPPPGSDNVGFYTPIGDPTRPPFVTVVARPRPGLGADALAPVVRRELAVADPNLPLYFAGSAKLWHEGALGQARIIATLFGVFGLVAIVLSSVGLYGVMSFSVNQRTQEIGIRMALGADAGKILAMVVRQGALQLGLGLALGFGVALVLVRIAGTSLQGFLFRVDPTDPLIYGSVTALLAGVAVVSCLVPARRATRVDPMIALRAE